MSPLRESDSVPVAVIEAPSATTSAGCDVRVDGSLAPTARISSGTVIAASPFNVTVLAVMFSVVVPSVLSWRWPPISRLLAFRFARVLFDRNRLPAVPGSVSPTTMSLPVMSILVPCPPLAGVKLKAPATLSEVSGLRTRRAESRGSRGAMAPACAACWLVDVLAEVRSRVEYLRKVSCDWMVNDLRADSLSPALAVPNEPPMTMLPSSRVLLVPTNGAGALVFSTIR